MAGIASAQEYSDGVHKPGTCFICKGPFRNKEIASYAAMAHKGVGVVEFCSKECVEKHNARLP